MHDTECSWLCEVTSRSSVPTGCLCSTCQCRYSRRRGALRVEKRRNNTRLGNQERLLSTKHGTDNERRKPQGTDPLESTSHLQTGATGPRGSHGGLAVRTAQIQAFVLHRPVSLCKGEVFAFAVYVWFLNCENVWAHRSKICANRM